jgi:hypothetical protein
MLAPLAIVGGAVAAYQLFGKQHMTGPGRPVVPSGSFEFDDKLEDIDEMWMHNAREYGIVAPPYQFEASRVPWGPQGSQMPYYIHRPGESHMDSPCTDTYQQIANALSHQREDFIRAFAANRPQMARKQGSPAYNGFTDEMTLFGDDGTRYTTQHMNWSWLPKQPSDSDYNDVAGLMAKAAPPDPALFTPTADFMTAPGVGFRYVQNH